jgi:peptidoglycan/LPS O-acetylase OafA/YrhL
MIPQIDGPTDARTAGGEGLGHRPQLDALRGLAVAAVLVHHLYPQLLREASWLPAGWEGVRLFFVLSGYLITGILLRCKAPAGGEASGLGECLRPFYARRFLRIFPAYYLTLAVAILLNFGEVRAEAPWHLLYLSNWLIALRADWGDYVGHLWSLAVEEQYYLVWPLLVLVVPWKRLPWLFGAFILCGPVSRALLHGAGCDAITVQVVTTSNLDTLGMGGLLAYLHLRSAAAAARFSVIALLLGAPIFVALRFLGLGNPVLFDLAFAGVCVFLVHHAAVGVKGPARYLLDFRPLQFLGTISYGVYLIHNFSAPAVALVCRRTNLPFPEGPLPRFLMLTGATLVAATLSWFLLEKPLNQLKRFFPYARRPEPLADRVATPCPERAV